MVFTFNEFTNKEDAGGQASDSVERCWRQRKLLKLAEKKSSHRQRDKLSDIKNLVTDTVGLNVHKKLWLNV